MAALGDRRLLQLVTDPTLFFLIGQVARTLFCGLGLLLAALVRPRDTWSAAAAGLTAGLAAGLAAFALGYGPIAVEWSSAIAQSHDMLVLTDGAFGVNGPDAAERTLYEEYPDLRQYEPGERKSAILYCKMQGDRLVGCYTGVWIGLLTALAMGIVPITCQTLIAGWLFRRRGRLLPVVFPYYELSFAWCWLVIELGELAGGPMWNWMWNPAPGPLEIPWAWLLLLAVGAALSTTAVTRRWPLPLRWTLYAAWYFTAQVLGVRVWNYAGSPRSRFTPPRPGRACSWPTQRRRR